MRVAGDLKRIIQITAVLAALLLLFAAIAAVHVQRFVSTPLDIAEGGELFDIPPGTHFAEISRRLEERGITSDGRLLRWYARWKEQANAVQAGEYLIKAGTTPDELLQQFTSGGVQLYSFTLIEGWNHRELLVFLQQHEQIESTMTPEDWPALLVRLGASSDSPEGLFLPETYRFPRGTTDQELLAQAYRLMEETLAEEWEARAPEAVVDSPYEALILASIIEKETARADERERISGVFTRRLQKNMRLQTDPTVIYGVGEDFDGNLTRAHLRTDTPYNTYTRHGLPPTPIAMPGRAAIHAALHPADGEELFFVATGLGDGSHKFSVTSDEHQAAVREYLKRLRESRN